MGSGTMPLWSNMKCGIKGVYRHVALNMYKPTQMNMHLGITTAMIIAYVSGVDR